MHSPAAPHLYCFPHSPSATAQKSEAMALIILPDMFPLLPEALVSLRPCLAFCGRGFHCSPPCPPSAPTLRGHKLVPRIPSWGTLSSACKPHREFPLSCKLLPSSFWITSLSFWHRGLYHRCVLQCLQIQHASKCIAQTKFPALQLLYLPLSFYLWKRLWEIKRLCTVIIKLSVFIPTSCYWTTRLWPLTEL